MFMWKKMLLVAGFLLLTQVAQAGELSSGKKDRTGFLIGFGLGAGAMNLRGEGESRTKLAGFGDLRIGGGITENILLMFSGATDYARIDSVNFYVYHTDVAGQFFVWEDFFLRPSIGAVIARASTSVGGLTVAADSKISFGAGLAAGYEFRFGKYFALSPELLYRYGHIRESGVSGHANSFGAQAGLTWYF